MILFDFLTALFKDFNLFSLPLSIKGLFASHMPRLDDCTDFTKPVSLQEIIKNANFPLTAVLQTVTGHDERTNGERTLHAGMRLKLLSVSNFAACLIIWFDDLNAN